MRFAPAVASTLLIASFASFASAADAALELPKRKSGLWEMTTTRQGGPQPPPGAGGAILMCIDEKTDDMSRQLGENASKDMCSKRDMRREGDRIVTDSVCRFGDVTATTRSVVSGRFDSGYEVDVKTKFDPPMAGMAESNSIIKARWLGPCKPDMRPGDVIMPNGMRMNMLDAEKSAPRK